VRLPGPRSMEHHHLALLNAAPRVMISIESEIIHRYNGMWCAPDHSHDL